ncbi:hypothetical protein P9943_27685, partial [Serratia nevei]|nr:hypothetical protein [Serratia nevei]
DLIMIVIRFLLYLDLMVIFGLPFFQIYGISGVRHETYNLTNFRSFITFAVVTGIILTGINMLLVSKEVAIKWSAAPDMTPQTVLYRRPVAQFSN